MKTKTLVLIAVFILLNGSISKEITVFQTYKKPISKEIIIIVPRPIKIKENTFFQDSLMYCTLILNHLKSRESYVPSTYNCPAGYKTIGYGHAITDNDKELLNDTLSEPEADSLLNKDFRYLVNYVRKDVGDSLPINKVIVLASFCFSTGIGYYKRHVSDMVKNNTITEEIYLDFCHYTSDKTGEVIKSELLYQGRQFEWELYNK